MTPSSLPKTQTKCKTHTKYEHIPASPQESLVAAAADQADDPNPNQSLSASQLNVPNAKFRQKTPFMHRIAQLGIGIDITR